MYFSHIDYNIAMHVGSFVNDVLVLFFVIIVRLLFISYTEMGSMLWREVGN